MTRVIGLVEGDASRDLSGVAGYLFDALDRHLPVVERVDYAPHGGQRLALAVRTFRPSRAAWRAQFHASLAARSALSRNLARRVARVGPEFDVALQVHGWVGSQPRPYAVFVDQTRVMAERGWPDWLPFRARERTRLLELERAMYHEAFHVFTMGEPARASLIGDYQVPPGRITVVGGGVCFRSLPAPTGPARGRSILFVGREFARKGGDVLLAAFEMVRAEVPDAVLHIVGPSRRRRLPGVVAHGRISDRGQMARLYADARVFCLPSHYEPFGLVLTEAMAHGVPCIGTRVQSIPEILDHGQAGILVPAGAPEPLADALLRLLGDEALARRVGLTGRRWIEKNFTWDRVAERMAPVLSSANRDLRSGP